MIAVRPALLKSKLMLIMMFTPFVGVVLLRSFPRSGGSI